MQLHKLLAFFSAVGAASALVLEMDEEPLSFYDFEERDLTLEERANGCKKGVHVFAAGGEGSVKGDLGYLQSLVDDIVNAIPNSDYHQIPYPPGADGPDSIAYATPHMRHKVHEYARKCPRTKQVLVGYSAGAAVVMDTLCGDVTTGDDSLPSRYHNNILATIVYGDPTFIAGLSYDQGTCTSGTSEVPRTYPGKCFPFGKRLRSYCDAPDPVCCGGDDPNDHFVYPSEYDSVATQYVKAKWNYYKNHKGKHS